MVLTRAGKRKEYLSILVATDADDGQGGGETTWMATYYEWARAKVLSYSKALEAGGIKFTKAVEFDIRPRTDYTLSTIHRIRWGSTDYMIASVIPTEDNDDLKVLAYA